MAKYDVKFSCGHTETISLIGPVAERERKIKYFEEYGVCSECYKKQKEAEREKQNAEKRIEGYSSLFDGMSESIDSHAFLINHDTTLVLGTIDMRTDAQGLWLHFKKGEKNE